MAAGCTVTVVEAAAVPLQRQLGEAVGAHLSPWYAAAGVTLLTDSLVDAVDASGVHFTSHSLPADVVLAAVGARPATDWLRGTLPVDGRGSILVDATGAVRWPSTGDAPAPAGIYAVGDCATRLDDAWEQVPGGHWSAALLDPDTVARHIMGLEPGPRHAPYVFSTQLGHDLAFFGLPDPARDRVVLRGDPSGDAGWGALYVSPAGLVTGILAVDSPRDVAAARKLLVDGPVHLDLEVAADPARPLKSTLVQPV